MSNAHEIGTIISSVLSYDKFSALNNDPPVFNAANSVWAPCDGRPIAGSNLAEVWKHNDAPDLRGRFLRGLNEMYGPGQPNLDKNNADPDGDNRKSGDYQGDTFAKHTHQVSGSALNCGAPPAYWVLNNTPGPTYHQTTSEAGGSSETRAKNIAAYFYIKIN